MTDNKTNEVLFGGGAGGGKTYLACAWLLVCSQIYPGTRWLIGRKELKRLKQTVLVSLFDLMSSYGFFGKKHFLYNSTMGSIIFNNGSQFIFADLAPQPSDPNYDRFGSLELTGAFIEEAAEVEQKAKDVIFSRIRYKLAEHNLIPKLLMTCNPSKNWLYKEFYKPWKKKTLSPDKAFVRSLVTDNPHMPKSYIQSLKKLKDRVLKERLLFGNWEYEDDDLSLMGFDAINDLFSNEVDSSNDKYIVADIARFGVDKAVISLWEGLKVTKWITYDKSSMPTLETEILLLAKRERVALSHVLVDEGGIGGGVVDHLKCKGFVSNAAAIDERKDSDKRKTGFKINFQNLRAQCYYELADKVNDRLVRVETESQEIEEKIIEELEAIKARDIDKDSKLRVIGKDDIKILIGRSPDFADTMMMRMYFEVKPEKKKTRVYSNNPLA